MRRLRRFAPLGRGARRARRARQTGARMRGALTAALERDAWDGDWYRRGYFDDGTPLARRKRGVPHRFHRAVLGGDLRRGEPGRAARAMAAVDTHLVRREEGLVALFTPPFDRHAARSRLHQRLSAGHPRKRRPVHPCGRSGRCWLRGARRWRQGRRALLDAQPDQPRAHSRPTFIATRSNPMSWAATSIRRAPCRARRLDLVHGFSRLDAARGCREPPRPQIPRSVLVHRSLHTKGLGPVRGDGEVSNRAIFDLRRESRGELVVASSSRRLTDTGNLRTSARRGPPGRRGSASRQRAAGLTVARSGPHKTVGVERRFLARLPDAFDCQAISSSPLANICCRSTLLRPTTEPLCRRHIPVAANGSPRRRTAQAILASLLAKATTATL